MKPWLTIFWAMGLKEEVKIKHCLSRTKGDILLVQVYVDDIIFGSTNKELCTAFEKLMKDKFQMSSMGELTFFLGLQVQQKKDGIFISQDKYVDEILKKFNYTDVKSASTPVDLEKPLVKDGDADNVDVHLLDHMIGRKPTLGLWYSRDSPFELVAYTDSDYAGATQDRKSTTGGCLFLGNRLISWQCKKQIVVSTSTTKAEYASQKEVGTLRYLSLVVPLKKVGDEAVHKELGDRMERAATTASSLEAEQESATASTNVNGEVKLTASIDGQAKTITEASLRRHLKLEDNGGITSLPSTEIFKQLALMGYVTDSDKLTFRKGITSSPLLITSPYTVSAPSTSPPPITETTPTVEEPAPMPYESPLQSFQSLGRDEGSVSLNELMDWLSLVKRVKKLEKQIKIRKARRRTKIVLSEDEVVEENSSKQERSLIKELDMDADISLVPLHDAEIQEKISDDTEVLLEEEETTELIKEPTELVEDQGSGKKREREYVLETFGILEGCAKKKKDKGKAIMIEDESVQKKSKKQVQEERLGHEEAIRLQEQIDEEERKRIARDAEIAKQLQEEYDKAGKKEAVTEVDTAHVIDWNDPSVIRYHALQNRPRSVAEVRKNMMVYLKNQGGYKMKDFKGMSYDDIRPIFEKVWDQIHSFVPMDSEEEVQRLKRAGQDVEAEPAKRQRTEEVSESVQEQTDEEPKTDELSQEQLNQMKIIRVGNHTEVYQVFEDMLKNFDRDDLIKLWSLVQERYNSSGLTEDKEIELWVELKMLFEPDVEIFLELHKYMHDPLNWWLYDTCVVHHVSTEKGQDIFMLVEKDYPLTKGLATLMLVNKLRVDQHSEMADELLIKINNIANRPRN
ncbi:putative ribonuclease H-like domain-containing protein [Tanacetum coccineum]